tara:strand:+ start:187 stop:540 length:354 start_codon:yes stop_codon:yes gene_type:complete
MAFNLKSHSDVFGIHEKTSTFGTPVIIKDNLEMGVQAEANRDGTIFVSDKLSDKEIEGAVKHEKVHLDQIAQGRLQYSEDSVTWKKDTRSPARVYKRSTMNEGHPDFEWENEAYKQS